MADNVHIESGPCTSMVSGHGKKKTANKQKLNRMYMNMDEIQNHSRISVICMPPMCICVDGVKTIWQDA